MRVEVYESDRDALDAVAGAAEAALRDCGSTYPALAVAGGRGGRAIMLSLAERKGIPWDRVRVTVVDDVCAPAAEAQANRRLLDEHLGSRRGGTDGSPQPAAATPAEAMAAFESDVYRVAGAEAHFDLIVVELGPNGELGALPLGTQAADAATVFARVPANGNGGADALRIGLGPAPFMRAKRVIVVVLGAERSAALKRALCGPSSDGQPAALVHPSDRSEWFVDRAAAAELLRCAEPARA